MAEADATESTTIARPIKLNRNANVFTFTHRHMWSIPTDDSVIRYVKQDPTETLGGNVYYRNQFRTIPTRAISFWMAPGEIAMISQFNQMRFLSAKLKMHEMSYRTQFITGSGDVGFANSNIQLHGMVYENNLNKLPVNNVWGPTDTPITATPVNGFGIQNRIWPDNNSIAAASVTTVQAVSTCQFTELPWRTWYFAGAENATGATGQTFVGSQLANYQYPFLMLGEAQILGKHIKDWEKHYDLERAWHGRWLPIRPFLSSFSTNGDWQTNGAPGGTDGNAMTVGGLLNGDKGEASAQNYLMIYDMWVCPPDGFHDMVMPRANVVEMNMPGPGAVGTYNSDKQANYFMDNLQVGIEHLKNPADGSVVKAVMDFYLDTEITVEVDFDYSGQYPAAQLISIVGEGKDQSLNALIPVQWQCTNTNPSLLRTALTSLKRQSTSYFQSGGFGSSWAPGMGTYVLANNAGQT